MRGHFRYLRFKTFPMTPRTPQCKVFWALLSNSKHSGLPEDSNSSLFFQVLGFTPTLGQSRVATILALKVFQLCTNHLVWVLCMLVWMSEACQLFLVPSRSSSTPFYPSKCYELRSVPRLLFLPLFSTWTHIWVFQKVVSASFYFPFGHYFSFFLLILVLESFLLEVVAGSDMFFNLVNGSIHGLSSKGKKKT